MNNKGQAMLEALIISSMALVGIIFILQLGLMMQYKIIVDELIEKTLICDQQKKLDCKNNLRLSLENLHFQNLYINLWRENNKSHLQIMAETKLNRTFNKESELELDLKVE